MKRILLFSLVCLIQILLLGLIYGIIIKADSKNAIKKKISRLPEFAFMDSNGNIFYSGSIHNGPVLIIKFDPDCEHCQTELEALFNSALLKSKTTILLITNAEKKLVLRYLGSFNTYKNSHVITLFDEKYIFADIFGKDLNPTNVIYDKDLRLYKIIYGEYRIELLMKYLSQCE